MANSIPKLKLILLGDSGVGKTSLINRYVFKKFQHNGTIDFPEILSTQLEIDGKIITLQILDTNGQEHHGGRGLEATFFSNAKGCMLVYAVNDPKSFDNLENWHNELITRVTSYQGDLKSFPFILLGNKDDVNGRKNKELFEKALEWCQSKGQIHHLLTSAKDSKNVNEAFQHIAKIALKTEAVNMMHEPQLDESKFVEKNPNPTYNPPSRVPHSDEGAKKPQSAGTNEEQSGHIQKNKKNSQVKNLGKESDDNNCPCTIV